MMLGLKFASPSPLYSYFKARFAMNLVTLGSFHTLSSLNVSEILTSPLPSSPFYWFQTSSCSHSSALTLKAVVLELGFSKEIKYIHVSQIIYCKKLPYVIVKADKYQHLHLASWKLRRAIMCLQSKDMEKKQTNKTMSQLKTVKQETIPLTCVIQTFNCLDEAHTQNEGHSALLRLLV